MNIWQFAGDHPLLTAFIVYCTLVFILKLAAIIKGSPVCDCDDSAKTDPLS